MKEEYGCCIFVLNWSVLLAAVDVPVVGGHAGITILPLLTGIDFCHVINDTALSEKLFHTIAHKTRNGDRTGMFVRFLFTVLC